MQIPWMLFRAGMISAHPLQASIPDFLPSRRGKSTKLLLFLCLPKECWRVEAAPPPRTCPSPPHPQLPTPLTRVNSPQVQTRFYGRSRRRSYPKVDIDTGSQSQTELMFFRASEKQSKERLLLQQPRKGAAKEAYQDDHHYPPLTGQQRAKWDILFIS